MQAVTALFLVLGDQLFPVELLPKPSPSTLFFMAEDFELCTRYRYHKHKLILYLSAMRQHAQAVQKAGHRLHYEQLASAKQSPESERESFEDKLLTVVRNHPKLTKLVTFAINDEFFSTRIQRFCAERGLSFSALPSPMFLTPPEVFAQYLKRVKKPFMKTFYQEQRQRLKLLLDADGNPAGGRWSFDEENRQRLPPRISLPSLPVLKPSATVADVQALVDQHFAAHPGTSAEFWLPTTRRQALAWLDDFLASRLAEFGPYEDALSDRSPWLFHSILTPLLNTGLLLPSEVVDAATAHAADHPKVPLASLEGFYPPSHRLARVYSRHLRALQCQAGAE